MRLQLKGVDQMMGRLGQLARLAPSRFDYALQAEAEIIMTEAKRRTPVRYGHLRASGFVEPVQAKGRRNVSVTLGFGGPSAPYAVYVHENLRASHKVGQAKFLESAMNDAAPTLAQNIAARVQIR